MPLRRVAQEVAAQPLPPGQERRDEVGAVEVGLHPHAPAARRPAHAGAVAEHQVGPGEQAAIGRILDGDVEGVGVDEEQRGRLGRGHQRGEPGQGRLDGLVHHLDAEDPDRGGGLRARACRAEPGQERRADPGDVEQQHGGAVDAAPRGRPAPGPQASAAAASPPTAAAITAAASATRAPAHGKADREHAARRGGGQHERRRPAPRRPQQRAGEAQTRDQEQVEDQARRGRRAPAAGRTGRCGRRGGWHGRNNGRVRPLQQGERRRSRAGWRPTPGTVGLADQHRCQRPGDAGEADHRRHGQRQQHRGVAQQLLARRRGPLPLQAIDGEREGGEGHRHEHERDRPVDDAERHGVDGDRVRAGQPLEEQPVAVRDHARPARSSGRAGRRSGATSRRIAGSGRRRWRAGRPRSRAAASSDPPARPRTSPTAPRPRTATSSTARPGRRGSGCIRPGCGGRRRARRGGRRG